MYRLRVVEPVVLAADAHLRRYEFLADVFLEKYDGKQGRAEPLVAAEIEAYPGHGVKYVFEGEGYSDYLWDFTKLLYVRSPKRLFVACTLKGEPLDTLTDTMARGYRDACLTQADGDTVAVLLPAGETEKAEARLGRVEGGELVFRPLVSFRDACVAVG